MSHYAISKFLFDFNRRPDIRQQFKQDADATLAQFNLSPEEHAALTSFDFRYLYDRGIHPLLLTALANGAGIGIPHYMEAIR